MAVLCALLALAGAVACWYGSWRADADGTGSASTIERVGKIVVPLALIGWVLASGGIDRPGGVWLVIALVFALGGDIALLGASATAFLAGLGVFALAQVAFITAFVAVTREFGVTWWMAVIGLAFAGLFAVTSGRRIHRGALARENTSLGYGVLGYVALMTIAATAAGATGRWLVLAGAFLFVLSDTVLALHRYVGPRAHAGLFVMITYHLALAGLTVGLAG